MRNTGVDFSGVNGQYSVQSSSYNIRYQSSIISSSADKITISLPILLERYGDILWPPGRHKYTVTRFIAELHDLLEQREFSFFSQHMLDGLRGALRRNGNSNATINRKMAALSKLLRKAHKMKDLSSLPEFVKEREGVGRIRFLDPGEEQRLFTAIRGYSEISYRLCIFLIDTGARLGEAIDLRWTDITPTHATFWVTKSKRSRSVPMTRRVREAIELPRERCLGPFHDITQQQFRTVWNKAKQDVGLAADPDVVPHVLRHTCASRLVQGGIDIRRVQTWLGHQTLQMTMRYAHLASRDLDSCVPVLEIMAEKSAGLRG